MNEFSIGDYVYASDWCYGQIVDITDTEAMVEFETAGGGGCFSFDFDELVLADPPKRLIKCGQMPWCNSVGCFECDQYIMSKEDV